jgi:hypothetical protein
MKNIYILPTDQPSRLYLEYGDGDLCLSNNLLPQTSRSNNQHIYITSDEEIKEGDWCLDKFNQRWKLEDKKLIVFDSKGITRFSTDNVLGHECKKIIITTDPTLVEDGVQEIDDEFLEWFVKNPNCEFVYIKYTYWEKINSVGKYSYKIIIPKEEPKLGYVKSETEFSGIEYTLKDGSKQFVPKQEILEKAAGDYANEWEEIHPTLSPEDMTPIAVSKIDFIEGAKWQAERMYSEEEVLKLLNKFSHRDGMDKEENLTLIWFKQFKKK